jgi:hypothetical protein
MLGIDEGGPKAQHTQKEEGWKAISHGKTGVGVGRSQTSHDSAPRSTPQSLCVKKTCDS